MNDGNRSGTVVGVIVSTLILTTIVIALRLYSRIVLLRAFGADDVCIVITWLMVLTYNGFILASASHGYGRSMDVLGHSQYAEVVKLEVIGQFFAVLAYPPGKISIAICLGRIFPGKHLHWILWFIGILSLITYIPVAIISLAQCSPAAKQWNPSIPGSCINPQFIANYTLPWAVVGVALDFTMAAIPWYYIRRLQMATRDKAGIGMALSLGFVAGGFAIARTYYITTLSSRTDYAHDTIPLILWATGELCAINIGASIPMLHPLLPKKVTVSNNSGSKTMRWLTRRTPPQHFNQLDSIDRELMNHPPSSHRISIRNDQNIKDTTEPAPVREQADEGRRDL